MNQLMTEMGDKRDILDGDERKVNDIQIFLCRLPHKVYQGFKHFEMVTFLSNLASVKVDNGVSWMLLS
jgi:hypothetical protein